MKEIKLTGTLKTDKAVVVSSDQDVPDGYIAIAGGFVGGEDISIAVPESLMNQPHLFNKLARQAQICLMNTIEDDLPGGEF